MVYDQAVIVEIDLASLDNFGDKEAQKAVRLLEKQLEEVLSPPAGLDGDEFGEGEVTIYMYGPSAEELFKSVEPVLKRSPFNHINITVQYGLPDDPATKEKKFSL